MSISGHMKQVLLSLVILCAGLRLLAAADDKTPEPASDPKKMAEAFDQVPVRGQVRVIASPCDTVWAASGPYFVGHSMYLVAADRAAGIMTLREWELHGNKNPAEFMNRVMRNIENPVRDVRNSETQVSVSYSDEGRSCSVRVQVHAVVD